MLQKLQNSRNGLGLLFLTPAAVLLLVFLTYPLGLGIWLGFTDTKIGRAGEFIGLENYAFLWDDSVTRLALFNTLVYTFIASVLKFGLGLWLAILLNERLPELGIDFAMMYPTFGLGINIIQGDLQLAAARAYNRMTMDMFKPYLARFAPVASIPSRTPKDAIAELNYVVQELGYKAIILRGNQERVIPGAADGIDPALENAGKTLGSDLRKGKLTLPILYLLQHSEPAEREGICAIILDGTDEEIGTLVKRAKARLSKKEESDESSEEL